MKKLLVLFAASALISVSAFAHTDPILPKEVLNLHAFQGYWPGTGTLQVGTNPIIHIHGFQTCEVTAKGWSIQCIGHWEGDQSFLLDESFQGAFDAASGLINWQVMYSQGPQAFTVSGIFNDAGTQLVLSRSFMSPDGLVEQNGAWTFLTANHRTLFIDTKVNGQLVSRMDVDVTRPDTHKYNLYQ